MDYMPLDEGYDFLTAPYYTTHIVEAVRVKKALTSYGAAPSTIFGMGVL